VRVLGCQYVKRVKVKNNERQRDGESDRQRCQRKMTGELGEKESERHRRTRGKNRKSI